VIAFEKGIYYRRRTGFGKTLVAERERLQQLEETCPASVDI